jgi:hypothetical protein
LEERRGGKKGLRMLKKKGEDKKGLRIWKRGERRAERVKNVEEKRRRQRKG